MIIPEVGDNANSDCFEQKKSMDLVLDVQLVLGSVYTIVML